MVYPVARLFFPLLQGIFIKKITGLENIPKKGPFIIAGNHQCHLDGFLLMMYIMQRTNQKTHFLAKKEFTGYFGKAVEKYGYAKWGSVLFVEIEGTKERGQKALKQASRLLNKGEIIGIFPEGTRTYTGALLEGRTGMIRIAWSTKKNIPIIPVGFKGGHTMLPRDKTIPRLWKSRISIHVGKPILLKKKKVTKKSLRDATTFVMKKIAKLAGRKYAY